ncbi:hypothetical protein VNO78_09775 [Psophocarpus tetragonolobus]|uniref:Uncharacterized protein n=1 Tax=Psophocarpus tetragonolobus TaxID=3891 RepID=A0AAN9SWF3_PSOTE
MFHILKEGFCDTSFSVVRIHPAYLSSMLFHYYMMLCIHSSVIVILSSDCLFLFLHQGNSLSLEITCL